MAETYLNAGSEVGRLTYSIGKWCDRGGWSRASSRRLYREKLGLGEEGGMDYSRDLQEGVRDERRRETYLVGVRYSTQGPRLVFGERRGDGS
jgi:hypothetical protein